MTPPPPGAAAPVAGDLLGEDWFGEGSAFDTGEQLAQALMVLAGGLSDRPVPLLARPSAPAVARPAAPRPAPVPPPSHRPLAPSGPAGEFQVAVMPSSQEGEPGGWTVRPPTSLGPRRLSGLDPGPLLRRGWSIRQSVQLLRVTEEILSRLRGEAAELTWQLAADAHREADA